MSTSVTLNGVSYSIPAVGEDSWGTAVSTYLIALSTGVLSKAAGAFTLTAEADFGATYGLKAAYFKSRGTVSTVGIVRLANDESVSWRNTANNANLSLKVNSSNVLEFNGNPISALALGAANTVLKMNAGGTATEYGLLVNANIDAAAGIVYSKLSLSDSIVNADINSAAAIARSKIAAGSNDHVVINGAGGALSSEAQLDITRGGTGQSTANAALNALLPSQTSQNGKILGTDGINSSWVSPFTNPMTTTGDIVYSSNGSGTPARLGVGANTTVLTGGTTPAWSAITNTQIDASAAISFSKLASLTSANILVGNGSNVATAVAMTGDIGISNAGVTAIQAGVIVNADVSASAAIAGTKISPSFGSQVVYSTSGVSIGAAQNTGDLLVIDNNSAGPAMRIVDNNDRFLQISKTSGDNRANFYDSNSNKNLLFLTESGLLGSDITSWASSATQNIGFSVTTGEGNFVKFTSSRRYKHDIENLENVVDTSKIYDLRPVAFKWNSDNGADFGFIAEEVAELMPQAALYATDSNGPVLDDNGKFIPEAVRYQQLVAVLVAEMKKLKDRIEDLEALV